MILYHGSNTDIVRIELPKCRPNKDFGKGFYLSDNKEFSIRWAKKRKGLTTYINTYELDTDGLNIKKLRKALGCAGSQIKTIISKGYKITE